MCEDIKTKKNRPIGLIYKKKINKINKKKKNFIKTDEKIKTIKFQYGVFIVSFWFLIILYKSETNTRHFWINTRHFWKKLDKYPPLILKNHHFIFFNFAFFMFFTKNNRVLPYENVNYIYKY